MEYTYDGPQYPELYYRLYPKVEDCVDRYMGDYRVDPNMTDEEMQEMIDEIYERMIEECPEIDQDSEERRSLYLHEADTQQRPFYGRRRLLRDIIGIILLRELLRRRRRPYYGYPGYGYPGHGYGPGYY
ncbi:hypothetical protein [Brassicibacter mesophilus]|uniref:hypothetical protein n=1 Tax=Brassicibacter mesophilus TaxID=745119 RepID=UPI003D1F853D